MIKIVHNKILGGWLVVMGKHQAPISGCFSSKQEAHEWLVSRGAR